MEKPFILDENSPLAQAFKASENSAPAEPVTTTAIKEMLKAVVNDDIKITISRDKFIPSTTRIRCEGKNNISTRLINHPDLDSALDLVGRVSLLIIKALQDLNEKEREMENDLP